MKTYQYSDESFKWYFVLKIHKIFGKILTTRLQNVLIALRRFMKEQKELGIITLWVWIPRTSRNKFSFFEKSFRLNLRLLRIHEDDTYAKLFYSFNSQFFQIGKYLVWLFTYFCWSKKLILNNILELARSS